MAQEGPTKRAPIIGIVMTQVPDREIQRISCHYLHSVIDAGGVPVLIPIVDEPAVTDRLLDACDGVLLTGGQDLLPATYGADEPTDPAVAATLEHTPLRDRLETRVLDRVTARDVPCAGICRGMQMMNAYFGGTLYQDLALQFTGRDSRPGAAPIEHRQPLDAGMNRVHGVDVKPGTVLAGIFGAGGLAVNSLHHQGVRRLAPGLVTSAVADDGLVEGVEHPGYRHLVGVQWHPEYFGRTGDAMHAYFTALVDAARDSREMRRDGR